MKIFKTLAVILLVALASDAFARSAPGYENTGENTGADSKAVRPVQENRVHRAGLFWMNVTNNGYYGNPDNLDDPCTGRNAVSGELPGGSGTDFLFAGALLFGGYIDGKDTVSNVEVRVFDGPLVTSAYDGWDGNPMPRECWPISFDDDAAGTTLGHIVESSNVEGRISCLFEEVYDPFATAEEQFNLMYSDKFVQQSPYTGMDTYDKRQHIPLGIEVRQKSYAWSYDYAQKFVIIDYTLYNRNNDGKDIYDFFMGMYLDCDIGMNTGQWTDNYADDLGGFIQKWDNYIDPASNQRKTVNLNLAWAADNDGRNYTGTGDPPAGEPRAGAPLDGATSIATVRVLRNPNPNLRYAFNMYVCGSGDEAVDWGPRWQTGLHGSLTNPDNNPVNGIFPVSWQYDLTPAQKGYDDYNQDGLLLGGVVMYGGRTEGRPCGDKGKYMVMSNDEFDYEQYKLRDLYLGLLEDPDYMLGTSYAQAEKWQTWNGDPLQPDGSIQDLNNLANGADVKYLLSFGPLGTETWENIGTDTNLDGTIDSYIANKKVWKFTNQDSLKLTLAFIVNENFHTSLEQDPNYDDDSVVDLEDGLDPELYTKGWYDALYNVIWAERVYDIPMFDTYVKKFGKEMGDGWYGEDVGKDLIFGDLRGDTFCWWVEQEYSGPDAGEGDFELDSLLTPIVDVYTHTADSEDNLLPHGREQESQDGRYGITGNLLTGDRDGYGYMVKYDKEGGVLPQGTWIRYGFDNDKLDVGDGVPDFTGPPPPPSPKIEVTYDDNSVIIEWQSHEFFTKDDGYESFTGPELFIDPFTRVKDFEGYQVQMSPDVNSQNYVEVFSVDKINYIYENSGEMGDFYDSPIETDNPDTLAATFVAEGKIWVLRPYGDNRAITTNHSKTDVYEYTTEATTRIIEIAEGVRDTISYNKYKFVLLNKLYAKENYIAVTSSDYGDPKTGTPALKSNPAINGKSVIPTKISGTDDVYVVPNPYRGDVDYEAMGWENVDQADVWEEQDRKIVFMNVPLRSVLRIYTLGGDLVKTIGHNGNARVSERYQYGEYGISWDLINDNNQAVASGIYLFSVQDVDKNIDDFVGKFVIIK